MNILAELRALGIHARDVNGNQKLMCPWCSKDRRKKA